MVKLPPTDLDATFGALADSTRREIIARLAVRDHTVSELAEPFAISLPAISKHLRVLERAGLMRREVVGRVHHCHLVDAPLRDAAAWITRYRQIWESQLDALAAFLDETAGEADSEE